jgi:hypothetical protein
VSGASDQRCCADDEEFAQVLVAHLGDATEFFFAAARVLKWCQPEPGCELPPGAELARIGNGCSQRGRTDRTDPWNCCKAPCHIVRPLQSDESAIGLPQLRMRVERLLR